MHTTDQRPAYSLPAGTIGLHAPKSPDTARASAEHSRRLDPAAGRSGASYPIPALSGYRVEASSRHFL